MSYLHLFIIYNLIFLSQPHFERSVRSPLTLPKMGLGSPSGLLKTQSAIAGVKTPFIEAFFILLKRSWGVDVQNGLAWSIWTFVAQVMVQRRAMSQTAKLNWQFDSRPLKVRNRPDSCACRWSATHHWKALEESYNFGLDLVPIRVRGKKLWTPKVPRVQTRTISGLHFGSLGKKNHLDASATESCREYYMGEGGGFPRIRAVVSQVNPRSPVACPNAESVHNEF
jgi:hypothetical protein